MAPGGDGDGDRPPFRWLDVARYAAACTVTVLIIIVVCKAIKVVVVPDSLYVSVVQGSILVTPTTVEEHRITPALGIHQPRPALLFHLNLRIDNPRRHGLIYYVNVTAYLFDNDTPASSSDPMDDSFVFFMQYDQAVPQLAEVNYFLNLWAVRAAFTPRFFDLLYGDEGARMSGVTMRLDASLVIETYGLNTSRPVSYYCWPLIVLRSFGGVEEDLGDDVFCRDVQGSRFI